jgi:hypothetical protein
VHDDVNMAAAGLLYDMAALQAMEWSQFSYTREINCWSNEELDEWMKKRRAG